MNKLKDRKKRHIILIGASVGKAWTISNLPQRVRNQYFTFEYIEKYQFDKSQVLKEIIQRTTNKPDAVIIKECAAYFPSDISFRKAKSLMMSWINECLINKIMPVPATIIPVTTSHDDRFKTHNPLKRIIKRMLRINMATRMEKIAEYNDWLKEYAAEIKVTVLDLELPLRTNNPHRYLKEKYTKGDGLHLNAEGYSKLDLIVTPTLEKVKFFN